MPKKKIAADWLLNYDRLCSVSKSPPVNGENQFIEMITDRIQYP